MSLWFMLATSKSYLVYCIAVLPHMKCGLCSSNAWSFPLNDFQANFLPNNCPWYTNRGA